MNLSQQQYEQIARWLDGNDVQLSTEELAVAGEIRREDARLVKALDVDVPPQAMRRVERKLSTATAPLRRASLLRVGILTGVAAAALLLAIGGIFYALNLDQNNPLVNIAIGTAEKVNAVEGQSAIAAELQELERATALRAATELDDVNRDVDRYEQAVPMEEDAEEEDAG